jgi:DNA-directed RNA polymerase specialized sigma24 family protein
VAGVFSRHVQSVESGEVVDAPIRTEIRNVLRSELRRRGILEYGPSLLGYIGGSWDDQEAMDDLVHDCYVRAIATRLAGLRRNLASSGDIERLVRRNIRCFVGERQAALDPVGYAVYQNCKAVVRDLKDLGVLEQVHGEDAAVTADSEFVFASTPGTGKVDDTAIEEALKQTGELFEGVETLIHVGAAAQISLASAVRQLPANGVGRISLGSLKRGVCALVDEASLASKSVRELPFSSLNSEFGENLRTTAKTAGYEESESISHLAQTIRGDIAALPRSEAVKARLGRLLDHMTEVATHGDIENKGTLDELAERFGVSRSTMHDDLQSLRAVVRRRATAIAK